MPNYIRATSEAAQLLNSNVAYKNARPVDFVAILNDLGLKLVLREDIEDEALLNPMEQEIWIRDDDMPISRKFFSVAHEIGHWVLHSHDRIRTRSDNYSKLDPQGIADEQEANAFAAELLMPYDEVASCILHGYTAQDLVEYFHVSYEFAYYRYNFVSMGLY